MSKDFDEALEESLAPWKGYFENLGRIKEEALALHEEDRRWLLEQLQESLGE